MAESDGRESGAEHGRARRCADRRRRVRVDVGEAGDPSWHSLVRVASRGPLRLGTHVLRGFDGESVIEVLPTQHATATTGTYWLPPYFASWRGGSLALADAGLAALHAQLSGSFTPTERASLLGREQVFDPVEGDAVLLRYGQRYDFRVRLADLTRGGPDWQTADPVMPGTSILSIDFKRRHKPGPLNRLEDVPEAEPTTIVLEKPRLGYPEALFAGASMADLKADFDAIQESVHVDADGTPDRPPAGGRCLRSRRHESMHRRRSQVFER